MNPESSSPLDPDLADHLARERAFDGVFAWPPAENVTPTRPRYILQHWSIDREAALRALRLPAAGDDKLDNALIALWLASHDDQAIMLLRINHLGWQYQSIRDWCRVHVLIHERDALMQLIEDMLRAADENKTLPAHEGSASAGNV